MLACCDPKTTLLMTKLHNKPHWISSGAISYRVNQRSLLAPNVVYNCPKKDEISIASSTVISEILGMYGGCLAASTSLR